MIDFNNFYQLIAKNRLSRWLETLPAQIAVHQKNFLQKQLKKWHNALELLPNIVPYKLELLNGITATSEQPLSKGEKLRIEVMMRNLIPWRKGPFFLYGLNIDAEWRSNLKWQRILPYLSNLTGRIVLDVGCGNGYYLWRMIGKGARLAVGIDPNPFFLYQFEAIRKLLGNNQCVHLLPIKLKELPSLACFESVFSMGVIYHCRSPLIHLQQLKNQLISGGELILETLTIQGDENKVFMPSDRYAQMYNVYFIPSVLALKTWLKKCGFIKIDIANVCKTTLEEQRRTEWMPNKSLVDFLDPKDFNKTIEGYPAPVRAVLIATKP